MNCKPGDLALVVGVEQYLGINDKIVRLARAPATYIGSHPFWTLEEPFRITVSINMTDARCRPVMAGRSATVSSIADANLRPINGGDISDEEVRELYAPSMGEVSHG